MICRLLVVWLAVVLLAFSIVAAPALAQDERRIVVYTSVDQPVAAKVLKEFERQSGIAVTVVTDTEATKSVGLAEKVRAEQGNPQADVWWGNEPFHTINLASEGLLAPYDSPAAKDVPARFKDPARRWAGNALRARVIGQPKKLDDPLAAKGLSINDLIDPAFKGKVAMPRPAVGTMGGHVAALYVLWGDEKADAFFRKARDNGIKLLGGNGPVADGVGAGRLERGVTDNDDVMNVLREGGTISAGLPDQGTFGTLMIPTTVALVSKPQVRDEAKKLADYLLSPQVEEQLIDAGYAGWSLRETSTTIKAMDVDYEQVARKMPEAVRRAAALLEGREP